MLAGRQKDYGILPSAETGIISYFSVLKKIASHGEKENSHTQTTTKRHPQKQATFAKWHHYRQAQLKKLIISYQSTNTNHQSQ